MIGRRPICAALLAAAQLPAPLVYQRRSEALADPHAPLETAQRSSEGILYWLTPLPDLPGSTRTYAHLQLPNGLRCVIGSGGERVEFAMTVSCGSLDDPADAEGLAHWTEHVTLASDPAGLTPFVDGLLGEVNAFTREETTSFHVEFDADADGSDAQGARGGRDFGGGAAAAVDGDEDCAGAGAAGAGAGLGGGAGAGGGAVEAADAALESSFVQLSDALRRFAALFPQRGLASADAVAGTAGHFLLLPYCRGSIRSQRQITHQ
eukprot:1223632-Pleurochrysis_carterae.AAC.2